MTEKTTSTVDQVPAARKILPALLTMTTVVIAVGAVVLQLIGTISHEQYFRYWGLQADLFPKQVDWMLINGYYGVINQLTAFAISIFKSVFSLAFVGFAVFIGCFIMSPPKAGRRTYFPLWLQTQSDLRQRIIRSVLLALLVISAIPSILIMITAFMAVPAAIGESAGQDAAKKQKEDFVKGCLDANSSCVNLKNGEAIVSTGFVLASSSLHIAIYDVKLHRARVIPLDGLEIVSGVLPPRRN